MTEVRTEVPSDVSPNLFPYTFQVMRHDLPIIADALMPMSQADMHGKGLEKATRFRVRSEDKEVGEFTFEPMPGCCGVVVSTRTWIRPAYRGTGFGQTLQHLKCGIAQDLGYGAMIATCETSNIPEIVGASKARWKIGPIFTNPRTRHQLGIMIKVL